MHDIRRANQAGPRGPLWPAVAIIAMAGFFALVSVGLAGSPRSLPTLRSTTATRSPACARTDTGVASNGPDPSSRSGSAKSLVPTGAVTLLLCRYSGLGAPAPVNAPASASAAQRFTLERQRVVSSVSSVRKLASGLDAIPATPPGTVFCPADFGGLILAEFRYTSGPDDLVTIETSGCASVTNGRVHRLGGNAPVITRIEALVPASAAG